MLTLIVLNDILATLREWAQAGSATWSLSRWTLYVPLLAAPPVLWHLYNNPKLHYTRRMCAYYGLMTGVATMVSKARFCFGEHCLTFFQLMPTCVFPWPRRPENMVRCARAMNWVSRRLLGLRGSSRSR